MAQFYNNIPWQQRRALTVNTRRELEALRQANLEREMLPEQLRQAFEAKKAEAEAKRLQQDRENDLEERKFNENVRKNNFEELFGKEKLQFYNDRLAAGRFKEYATLPEKESSDRSIGNQNVGQSNNVMDNSLQSSTNKPKTWFEELKETINNINSNASDYDYKEDLVKRRNLAIQTGNISEANNYDRLLRSENREKKERPLTQSQRALIPLLGQSLDSLAILEKNPEVFLEDYPTLTSKINDLTGHPELTKIVRNSKQELINNAAMQIVMNYLYATSGKTVTPDEAKRRGYLSLPVAGEGAELRKHKLELLKRMVKDTQMAYEQQNAQPYNDSQRMRNIDK